MTGKAMTNQDGWYRLFGIDRHVEHAKYLFPFVLENDNFSFFALFFHSLTLSMALVLFQN